MKGKASSLRWLILLTFFTIAFAFIPPTLARDSRYYQWWTLDSLMGYPLNGNWENFWPYPTHASLQKFRWLNEIATHFSTTSGHEHMFLRLDLAETLRHDDVVIWMKIYFEPINANCGVMCKLDFFDNYFWLDLTLSKLDGSNAQIYQFRGDYRNYYWAIDVRMAESYNQQNNQRLGIFDGYLQQIEKNSGTVSNLKEVGGTSGWKTMPLSTQYVHEVEANYGIYASDGQWTAHAEIRNIGIRWDIANEDLTCDILDMVAISNIYGKKLGDPSVTWNYWMWQSNCWIGDVNVDLKIDSADMNYIQANFGNYY